MGHVGVQARSLLQVGQNMASLHALVGLFRVVGGRERDNDAWDVGRSAKMCTRQGKERFGGGGASDRSEGLQVEQATEACRGTIDGLKQGKIKKLKQHLCRV